jgi:uncharacterized protein YndB with AHSA1/START domain
MPKIDVTDEAVIDAPPAEAYKAILDEYAGVTNWFMPILKYNLRGDMPIREGSIVDITINPEGRVKSKVSEKMIKLVEAKSIEEEVAGDFVGNREWTFEPTAEGKTKVQCHFCVRTTTLSASVISPFVNIGKMHSDAMQKGYKALNSYLCKK